MLRNHSGADSKLSVAPRRLHKAPRNSSGFNGTASVLVVLCLLIIQIICAISISQYNPSLLADSSSGRAARLLCIGQIQTDTVQDVSSQPGPTPPDLDVMSSEN